MSNNALLIQQCSGAAYARMMTPYFARHVEYCAAHNFDYWPMIGPVKDYEEEPDRAWGKIALMQQACLRGYEYIAWLDTDAVIVDMAADLRDACLGGVNMARWENPLSHLQAGVIYLHNRMWIQPGGDSDAYSIMTSCLEEKKYWLHRFPTLRGWYEQGQLNEMYGVKTPDGQYMFRGAFREIDIRWNWGSLAGVECTNPAVVAWHGETGEARITRMKQMVEELERENVNKTA